jgi:hypothetical protein
MGVWVVDQDWYFQTAGILGQAASKVANGAGTAGSTASLDTWNMAGNDPVGTSWGNRFDPAASNTVQGVVSLAQAWSALAGRIYQAGVNHAWAEFRAGRGRLPAPVNLPPRPPIVELTVPPLRTSIGADGPGLTDILPGLVAAVGKETPNADTAKLDTSGKTWSRFATMINEAVGDVTDNVRRPDASLPDATAFYDTITSFGGPGEALGTDALSLSGLTGNFSAATTTMREAIQHEVEITALELEGSAAVSIGTSEVTGGASLGAETRIVARLVARAGNDIRGYISTLQAAAAVIDTFAPTFQPAMKAVLDKNSLIPAEGLDGSRKPTIRYFDRAKWEAWQRYKARGGLWDIDRWSKAYDQLKANAANGYWYDQQVADIMGYNKDDGWRKQYTNNEIVPGRRWDWAQIANNRVVELVENKSGRLDFDQLTADERALNQGIRVTYNINSSYEYSPSELAALQRLQDEFPGRFTVNRLP